jgi:hypothetical protein
MTTPRKRKPTTKVAVKEVADLVPVDTASIAIELDPSVLYPPVKASEFVHIDKMPAIVPDTSVPEWKRRLTYVPVVVGVVIIIVAIIALAL